MKKPVTIRNRAARKVVRQKSRKQNKEVDINEFTVEVWKLPQPFFVKFSDSNGNNRNAYSDQSIANSYIFAEGAGRFYKFIYDNASKEEKQFLERFSVQKFWTEQEEQDFLKQKQNYE